MSGYALLAFSWGCVWVWVEWVLSRGEGNVFRGIAGVFLLEVDLEDREDVVGFSGDFICDRVSNGG